MKFIQQLNNIRYNNERPVDNVNLGTFSAKAPVAKYYRKVSNCCNSTTEIIKNVKCCVKPTYSANTVVNNNYYTTHQQYIKAKCLSYEQNNTPTPNCNKDNCNFNVYKKSNETFTKQGSVSSSNRLLQLKYNTVQTVSRFNPSQSNYTGDNTHNVILKPQKCVNHRKQGDKTLCD